MDLRKDHRGQAITEYVLLLAVIVSSYVMLVRALSRSNIADALINRILKEPFGSAYRYGHVQAKGYGDNEGPRQHPRAETGQGSFRIFLNQLPK